ncbi:unnamed protein product [Diplocarpon coronariae]
MFGLSRGAGMGWDGMGWDAMGVGCSAGSPSPPGRWFGRSNGEGASRLVATDADGPVAGSLRHSRSSPRPARLGQAAGTLRPRGRWHALLSRPRPEVLSLPTPAHTCSAMSADHVAWRGLRGWRARLLLL